MTKYKHPVCRGSIALGTACKKCERCVEQTIQIVNEALAPIENAFMEEVKRFKSVGYGRMIQMIKSHWDAEHAQLLESYKVAPAGSEQKETP